MLSYHVAFYEDKDGGGFVVEVLDFPGVISQGGSLPSARRMLRDALREMAEFLLEHGAVLPRPDPKAKDSEASEMELIRLGLRVPNRPAPSVPLKRSWRSTRSRKAFLAYIQQKGSGIRFIREGLRHTLIQSVRSDEYITIPRSRVVAHGTMQAICKHLNVPPPPKH